MKIVINACYGGFDLSHEAIMLYAKLKGITLYCFDDDNQLLTPIEEMDISEYGVNYYTTNPPSDENYFSYMDINRTDPILIQVVEQLGDKASGRCANLVVQDIAKGTAYRIHEYDGYESIEERDQIDWEKAE